MKHERLLSTIVAPHMSEKAMRSAEKKNEYVFEVLRSANKLEIKKAVELMFNTQVVLVRTVNVKSRLKRFRNIQGKRKAWKKAYVTLARDQKIDLLSQVQA